MSAISVFKPKEYYISPGGAGYAIDGRSPSIKATKPASPDRAKSKLRKR